MPINISLTTSGLLAPGALERWGQALNKNVKRSIQGGLKDARPLTDAILQQETRRNFKLSAGATRFLKAWRIKTVESRHGMGLQILNRAKWFKVHTTGGNIGRRVAPRAILVPINTRLGSRIGTQKFKKLIDWLMQEKLTVIRNGILYVKPVMNTSRRGGVAVGARVNKRFRNRFQGSQRRPSGFEIKLNEHGLTPIAIIRTSIAMRRRFDLEGIAQRRIAPVVAAKITARFASGR